MQQIYGVMKKANKIYRRFNTKIVVIIFNDTDTFVY